MNLRHYILWPAALMLLAACSPDHPEWNDLVTLDLLRGSTNAGGDSVTSKQLFVTASTFQGDFGDAGGGGGKAAADAACLADGNYPGSGSYKALLVTTAGAAAADRRVASTTANVGDGQFDWVLAAATTYQRVSDSSTVFTTNASALFVFGTLSAPLTGTATTYRTGMNTDWTTSTSTCSDWDSNLTGGGVANQGEKGIGNATDTTSLSGAGGSPQCNQTYAIVCVEQ